MRIFISITFRLLAVLTVHLCAEVHAQSYSFEDIKSYPYPTELTAARTGSRIAWALNEGGKRNVYVAEGPAYAPRKLTAYNEDDGQEITSLSLSDDGKWVVFVRGGDHGSNWNDDVLVNPGFYPQPQPVKLWTVPFSGGDPKALSEGDEPVISPRSDSVIFIKGGQAWIAPVDASSPAKSLFTAKGTTGSLKWSPDGTRIAFVSSRGDHNLVGVLRNNGSPIQWIAPSFKRDNNPTWSPDGQHLAFVRTPGAGGAAEPVLQRRHQPWSIMTADLATGRAAELWSAPRTLEGSLPSTHGGVNLHWPASNYIVFLSYMDGWPHLYSISPAGGAPMLLTPGSFMAEHIRASPDGRWMVFAANAGTDAGDIDRRHVARVPVDRPAMEILTPGDGLEYFPVVTGDSKSIAMLTSTAQRPPEPTILSLENRTSLYVGARLLPPAFPQAKLVVPRQVKFKAPDGSIVHGQWFEAEGAASKKPAIIYVHGGPPRQMLLGWHYSDYYANAYATNQYLASLGFVVLSVNYRLGIGYGYKFHQPVGGGRQGASEYGDVRAAALWLGAQPAVDKSRIGIYGGSYGGYLTALGLARDSKLFAAGVDIHGVHDFTTSSRTPPPQGGYEKAPDADSALHLAFLSSPVASVSKWTSPVLVIHGDDDRNVQFSQSTDLVRRLEAKGVEVETMVIVDDTHHWMKHANAVTLGVAIGDFFKRRLMKKKSI